jgi:hypothetical protein
MTSNGFIPDSQITAKPRRRRNRIILISAIIFACVFVATQFFLPKSFEDVNVSMGVRATYSFSSNQDDDPVENTRYYNSVEEAISAGSDAVPENTGVEFPEVFRFESNDTITAFFFSYKKGWGVNLECYTLEKSRGSISEPVDFVVLLRPTNQFSEWPPFGYTGINTENCAAYSITKSVLSQGILSNSNNGEETLVGYTTDPAIQNLTILGQPPTDIIEFEYQGETWYVWYYVGLGAIEHLNTDPDFSFADFTYRQVVEVLEIRV